MPHMTCLRNKLENTFHARSASEICGTRLEAPRNNLLSERVDLIIMMRLFDQHESVQHEGQMVKLKG